MYLKDSSQINIHIAVYVWGKKLISFLQVFSNGDDQLEKAMEEILRDSEKDQNNSTAFSEGSSDACSQASGLGSAGQTNQPSLQLVLDPSTTGIPEEYPCLMSHHPIPPHGCQFFSLKLEVKIDVMLSGT